MRRRYPAPRPYRESNLDFAYRTLGAVIHEGIVDKAKRAKEADPTIDIEKEIRQRTLEVEDDLLSGSRPAKHPERGSVESVNPLSYSDASSRAAATTGALYPQVAEGIDRARKELGLKPKGDK